MRATLNFHDVRRAGGQFRPQPRILAATGAVIAGLAFLFAAEPAGSGIRGDLAAGADLVGALPDSSSPRAVAEAVRTAFAGRAISVDAARFPALVSVTLHGVDRRNCIAAEAAARRIEGDVVVQLQGYAAPAACADANDMTWRFMP